MRAREVHGGAVPRGAHGRPATGLGHYLRDVVYGASDGVVTTLAIVAGAIGASFEPRVGIVLGLANLAADGLSMGASNYLGLKSELQQNGMSVGEEMPWRHGLATVAAFVAAGAIPLLAYLAPVPPDGTLALATIFGGLVLVALGAVRGTLTGRPVIRAAGETVGVGLLAAAAAWAIGVGGSALLR